MKKILLFIFTFSIIFSLYNVKAFAYNKEHYVYIAIIKDANSNSFQILGNDFQNFNTYYVYNNNNYIAYNHVLSSYSYPSLISDQSFESVDDALNYIESTNLLNSVRSYSGNMTYLLTRKGTTSGLPQSDNFYPTYESYLGTLRPDISLCAFFFEPDSGTGLYSMYCFPEELDDNEVVTIHYNNIDNLGFEITDASIDTLKRCYLENGSNIEYYHSMEYWLEMIDQIKLENDNVIDFLFTTPIYAIYCDFIENNGNPNYNIFPLTEESWWDDIVNEIGFEDTELGFIWEWLFSDPDPDYHNVTIDNSPSPTPLPTPIPYRTTLIPDGNGGYEFKYEYEDENGNTITASAPPEQPNYDGTALVTQAVNMNISGVPVSDVEGVQSLLNVIGDADSEYQEGFQIIGKSFAILPSKWFMFFGIPAAIILIAGIIKSLLG